jgi:CrcB protein
MQILLIFIGGGIGAVCRFLAVRTVQDLVSGWIFPLGTLCVNMLGCLLIGFLAQISELRGVLQPDARLFLFVGILGGFTTFSSFGYETIQLMRDGEMAYAVSNAVGQLVLGLLCVWGGSVLARLI